MHEIGGTDDWSFIVRRVRDLPVYFNGKGGVSSALYKDSLGVSVDKDHLRDIASVIEDEERLHKLYHPIPSDGYKLIAIVSVDKEVCEETQIYVEDAPIENENIHHCILKKDKEVVMLSKGQARKLARNSKFLKDYRCLNE